MLKSKSSIYFMLFFMIIMPYSIKGLRHGKPTTKLTTGSKTASVTHDYMTPRANTLMDDADDLQPQLESEFRDKLEQSKITSRVTRSRLRRIHRLVNQRTRKPRRLWTFMHKYKMFHSCHKRSDGLPVKPQHQLYGMPYPKKPIKWDFDSQHSWKECFPSCGGASQSPINLPAQGLLRVKADKLTFRHYSATPNRLTLNSDGQRVYIRGDWPKNKWPLVYGGAAFSRRYLFHSMTFYWPSEHTVEGMNFPMESQVLHISSEYRNYSEAVKASTADPLAFLSIVNFFQFDNITLIGLDSMLEVSSREHIWESTLSNVPLEKLCPPFSEYVCYHGSLTIPPCTEAVLWIIRRKSLPITKKTVASLQKLQNPTKEHPSGGPGQSFIRHTQPRNDRKVYLITHDKKAEEKSVWDVSTQDEYKHKKP